MYAPATISRSLVPIGWSNCTWGSSGKLLRIPNAKMHSLGFNGGGEMKELEAPW